MAADKKQFARVRCVAAEPFMSGFRYGFRAVENPEITPEQNLGGVTLEVIRPIDEDRKPDFEPGTHYDLTLSPVPKAQTEDAAGALVIDPAAAGPTREDVAPVTTHAGTMPVMEPEASRVLQATS